MESRVFYKADIPSARFYGIAWGPPDADHPRGIIAGALENGSLDLWDADKLASGASDAFMSRTTKHTGAIKSLEFNPIKPQILATAGAKGELYIYNVEDIQNPFRLGNAAARSDDLECLAWNRKVANILATGGAGGLVTVWDLKTRKASLTLNNNRKPVSSIAWDPNNSTKLLTATPDDSTPVIFLWNLRNSNAPERTLSGHEQGVLSLSWCQQDPDLLISCGKDNKTLVWNPQTGEKYGEFPEATNWTFLAAFNPHNPNFCATASFDGKITIQTLQTTNASAAPGAGQSNLNDEDFFSTAHSQPQGASFTLEKAPAWLERPIGASFGFGGKVVLFRPNPIAAGQPRSSKVQISRFAVDVDVGSASEKFEESLQAGDLKAICREHMEHARTDEEKADWTVLETLVADNPRQQVVDHLGFSKDQTTNGVSDGKQAGEKDDEGAAATGGDGPEKPKGNRLSNFFADGEDGEDFLSDLAATKGAKTDNPFHLFKEGNTSLEDRITKALMLGDFETAAEVCLKEDRMADAFIIANCGGKDLVEKVQAAYLSQRKGSPSYLRLLGAVITENLWDVVYNADLADWKETLATLCTFAKPAEFPDLCEALGDRILETGSRKNASLCYLVGSKLEKVVSIWIDELGEAETAGMKDSSEGSTFSVHAKSLQQFIEKVTVFRQATKFVDTEKDLKSGWKLADLYSKYTEYADIVAAHGQLAIAQKYLDLLPATYPAAEVARNRVKLATTKAAPQPATNPRTASRAQPNLGYQPAQPSLTANPSNPYAAPAQVAPPHAYGPPQPSSYAPPSVTPYGQPATAYAPPQAGGYSPQTGFGQPPPQFGGPPRKSTPGVTPAPPRAKDVGTWNDVPLVTKAPPPRRTTPSVAPITSPFGAQAASPLPPPGPSFGGHRGAPTPPPPPPKAGQPPRVTSPLADPTQTSQSPGRPPSAVANMYAPPPPPTQGSVPPPMAGVMPVRTASPYNAPPSGAPPPSRYAPAPATQQPYGQAAQQPPIAPPPGGNSRPPPSNPYAPASQHQSQFAQAPYESGPPPQGGRPPVGPPPTSQAPPTGTPPPPRAAAPPKAKHPPGDRSHIPASALKLVEIFSNDMQRVSSKAPAAYQAQVNDTRKRLNLLFDHLNNGDLVKPDTVGQLSQLAEALEAKAYDVAQRLQVEIHRDKPEECGNWMVSLQFCSDSGYQQAHGTLTDFG